MPIIVTDENFSSIVNQTEKSVLVDFYATWCEPCSMLAPILENLEKKHETELVLVKANVDDTPLASGQFQVDRIPMIILFKNGQPIDTFTGFQPEPMLEAWLKEALKK